MTGPSPGVKALSPRRSPGSGPEQDSTRPVNRIWGHGMWHMILISAHAVAATAALIAGLVALPRARLFGVYLWCLVAMEVFLVAAIAVEWSVNVGTTRVIFSALAALGAVVVWRGLRARRVRTRDDAGPTARYFESVGFTLVALVDAFLVIAVLNAGAPGWAVAATGALVAAIGHVVLRVGRRRLVPEMRAPDPLPPA